jgi:hypothetical protein
MESSPGEHTVVVRVSDRFDNLGVAKSVVKTPAPANTKR